MKKTIFLLLSLLLLVAACKSGKKPQASAVMAEKSLITVTIEPMRYFAEAMAGERFQINCMVPAGHSPETYDPSPQQLMELAKSAAYFRTGYIGFERSWMPRLMENSPTVDFYNLSDGIPLIKSEGHHHHHAGEEECSHHSAEEVDPHVWNAPSNIRIIVGNMFKALCELDPEGADYFRQRHDSLCHLITETDSIVRSLLEHPNASRSFMIYHPALTYFAREYGLHQVCIEDDGKLPTPARLKGLVETSRKENVRIIFIQPEFDRRNAELVAQEIGAQVVPINPLSYHWKEELIHIATRLVPDAQPKESGH